MFVRTNVFLRDGGRQYDLDGRVNPFVSLLLKVVTRAISKAREFDFFNRVTGVQPYHAWP